MKRLLTFFACCAVSWTSAAQSLYFPPNNNNVWETIAPAALGYCPDRIDSLYEFLDGNNSKAFILLKDGKIVLEKYFDSFTKDSIWYWASAGKSLTAVLVGIAQQEGHLALTDVSSEYLGAGWTACAPAAEDKITVWHQLTMTSGLDDGVDDPYCTLDTCLVYKADAGARWAYHNAPYTLLDSVLRSATGQTLNAYFFSKLRNPIGMNGLFLPSGYNNVLYTNPRSMARFGLLILNKGNWNGTPILTDTAYFRQMTNTSQPLNRSYGYLWWLNGQPSFMLPGLQFVFPGSFSPEAPEDMIAALGKNGQVINVVPSQNLVFIRLGDAPGAGEVPVTLSNDIWKRINRFVCAPVATGEAGAGELELTLSPNPAAKEVQITWSDRDIDFEVSVWSATGRLEGTYKNQHTVPVGHLSPGVYVVAVERGGKWTVKRVVVAP